MQVGLSGIVTPSDWSFPQFVATCREAGYEAAELALHDQGWRTLDTPPPSCAAAAATPRRRACTWQRGALSVGSDFMSNDAAVRRPPSPKCSRA